MPVRRSAKTPTAASYEIFSKNRRFRPKNQCDIVLARPVETKNQKKCLAESQKILTFAEVFVAPPGKPLEKMQPAVI